MVAERVHIGEVLRGPCEDLEFQLVDTHQEMEVDHRMFQSLLSLPSCPLDPSRASRTVSFSTRSLWVCLACECVSGRTNLGQALLTVIYEGTLAVEHALRTHGQRGQNPLVQVEGSMRFQPNEELDLVLHTQGDSQGAVRITATFVELPLGKTHAVKCLSAVH